MVFTQRKNRKAMLRRALHLPAGNPNLSANEMNGLLRQFQSSFKYGGNPIVKRIDSSCLPSNSPCEDETICTLLPSGVNGSLSTHSQTEDSTQLLLAVLDGHYTRHSARFLKVAIPSLLSRISLKST